MSNSITEWNNQEIYKAVLRFDNGQEYTALSNNEEDNVLVTMNLNESEALTSGNPLGVMSPNRCNIVIYDSENHLVATNTTSPYHGFIRNGVKVTLTMSSDEGSTWNPLGVYYTESFRSVRGNGSYEAVSVTCSDRLEYIGNMEIPRLSAYAGVNVVDLLKELFKAIKLTTSDYYIDPTLSLNMIYSITKGDKLRDVLNSIAQGLVARITTDRSGRIMVVPAFPSVVVSGTLDDKDIESLTISHNKLSLYNKVRVTYNRVDNKPSEILYEESNVRVNPGLNKYENLEISKNIISVDGVYLLTTASEASFMDKVRSPNYLASQGGVDVDVFSEMDKSFFAQLVVEGRTTGTTTAFVETVVKETDAKVANTLQLESYVIQDRDTALAYVNKVADYLYNMEQEIVISGTLTPYLYPSLYINIVSEENPILTGLYLVTQTSINTGESYSTSTTLVKLRGA